MKEIFGMEYRVDPPC